MSIARGVFKFDPQLEFARRYYIALIGASINHRAESNRRRTHRQQIWNRKSPSVRNSSVLDAIERFPVQSAFSGS